MRRRLLQKVNLGGFKDDASKDRIQRMHGEDESCNTKCAIWLPDEAANEAEKRGEKEILKAKKSGTRDTGFA